MSNLIKEIRDKGGIDDESINRFFGDGLAIGVKRSLLGIFVGLLYLDSPDDVEVVGTAMAKLIKGLKSGRSLLKFIKDYKALRQLALLGRTAVSMQAGLTSILGIVFGISEVVTGVEKIKSGSELAQKLHKEVEELEEIFRNLVDFDEEMHKIGGKELTNGHVPSST